MDGHPTRTQQTRRGQDAARFGRVARCSPPTAFTALPRNSEAGWCLGRSAADSFVLFFVLSVVGV